MGHVPSNHQSNNQQHLLPVIDDILILRTFITFWIKMKTFFYFIKHFSKQRIVTKLDTSAESNAVSVVHLSFLLHVRWQTERKPQQKLSLSHLFLSYNQSFLLLCAGSAPPLVLLPLQLLRNKAYLVLLLCFGSGIAVFTCFSILLEQILCVQGYTNVSTHLDRSVPGGVGWKT